MSDQLPAWVYDVVIDLQRWADNHPPLHAEYLDQSSGEHRLQPVDDCGCKPLDHVPDEVKADARIVAAYLDHNPRWVVGMTQGPGAEQEA